MLSTFYQSYIQSVLTFSFIRWCVNVTQKDMNILQRIVNINSKITCFKQSTLTALYKSRYCVKPITSLMTIHIFYITSTSFCPRPEGSEPSHLKQTGSVIHLFQSLYDFSTTSTSDIVVRDTSFIMCVCCILFILYLFVKGRSQL